MAIRPAVQGAVCPRLFDRVGRGPGGDADALGLLPGLDYWDLSQWAARELHSWREFARSYLFGGLMWKLLCGDCSAGSYLSSLADAATGLLAGAPEQGGGQWMSCPWPAQRKNGFAG